MLIDDGLISARSLNGGVQRLYRWGNGGVSAVNASMLHTYSFAWEFAVIKFNGPSNNSWEIVYDTPLTCDVEVFSADDEANEFIASAKEYFSGEPK